MRYMKYFENQNIEEVKSSIEDLFGFDVDLISLWDKVVNLMDDIGYYGALNHIKFGIFDGVYKRRPLGVMPPAINFGEIKDGVFRVLGFYKEEYDYGVYRSKSQYITIELKLDSIPNSKVGSKDRVKLERELNVMFSVYGFVTTLYDITNYSDSVNIVFLKKSK